MIFSMFSEFCTLILLKTQTLLASKYHGKNISAMSLLKKPNVSTTLQKALVRNFEAPKLTPKLKDKIVLPSLPENREPDVDPGVPKYYYIVSQSDKNINFPELPLLSELKNQSYNELLVKKLEICITRCDFSQFDTNNIYINCKTRAYEELIQFIESENFTELLYPNVKAKIIELVYTQPTYPPYVFEKNAWKQNGIIRFTNWPHLCLFYTFLNRYIQQFGKQSSLTYETMVKFITLLQSPDEREREEVLEIVMKYMSFFPQHIEKFLKILLSMLIDSGENHKMIYCQHPILNIFVKVCPRYPDFFKHNRYKIFSALYLISIASHNQNHFGPLVLFLEKFFEMNPDMILNYTLKAVKNFPLSSLIDQVLHISMCNHIFERLSSTQIGIVAPYIASTMVTICESNCQKILAPAFSIWTNPKIKQKLGDHAVTLYPLIYQSLSDIIHDPKRAKCKGNTLTVLKSMQELNPRVFEALHTTINRSQTESSFEPTKKGWEAILNTASLRYPSDKHTFEKALKKYIKFVLRVK